MKKQIVYLVCKIVNYEGIDELSMKLFVKKEDAEAHKIFCETENSFGCFYEIFEMELN